jgi:hypothetical protein
MLESKLMRRMFGSKREEEKRIMWSFTVVMLHHAISRPIRVVELRSIR